MRCRTARQWITLALAVEAPPWALRALERHLEGCEGCRCERAAYAALDRALGLLPVEAAVPGALQREVARRIRQEPAVESAGLGGMRWWVGVPALAGAGVLALAIGSTVLRTEAPRLEQGAAPPLLAVFVPRERPASPAAAPARPHRAAAKRRRPEVPPDPPPELTARPDLFVDLPILRNLERMQHYEAIQTTTLQGREEERSNG